MIDVIIQAAILIALGVCWRILQPQGLDPDTLRRSLTTLVYTLLLPALVLSVLWKTPLSISAVHVALLAALGVFCGMGAAWLWGRLFGGSRPAIGAMLLAAAFPNATYMGLPVLEASLGPIGRDIAIQYDLFACTPLLLSIGILLAAHYGGVKESGHPLLALFKVPPLWAAVLGVTLNLLQVPMPKISASLLDMLGQGVVPLMLFSLGLSLRWATGFAKRLPMLIPILLMQLIISPAVVWLGAGILGVDGVLLTGVVLEAAMPSMVLGIVLCDRFRLDSSLYALAVTLSTGLSFISLPLWFEFLGSGTL